VLTSIAAADVNVLCSTGICAAALESAAICDVCAASVDIFTAGINHDGATG